MSRWKYRVEKVTVGENSQHVRKLTSGERREFVATSKKIATGEMQPADLPFAVAKMGCVDPPLTEEDAVAMPPDLMDACVKKIMMMSGMRNSGDETEAADDEKKTNTSSAPPTS